MQQIHYLQVALWLLKEIAHPAQERLATPSGFTSNTLSSVGPAKVWTRNFPLSRPALFWLLLSDTATLLSKSWLILWGIWEL